MSIANKKLSISEEIVKELEEKEYTCIEQLYEHFNFKEHRPDINTAILNSVKKVIKDYLAMYGITYKNHHSKLRFKIDKEFVPMYDFRIETINWSTMKRNIVNNVVYGEYLGRVNITKAMLGDFSNVWIESIDSKYKSFKADNPEIDFVTFDEFVLDGIGEYTRILLTRMLKNEFISFESSVVYNTKEDAEDDLKKKRAQQNILWEHYKTQYLFSLYWLELRGEKIEDVEHRCQLCNSSYGELNVHHRTYENLGIKDKEIKDTIVLCKRCHTEFHKITRVDYTLPDRILNIKQKETINE